MLEQLLKPENFGSFILEITSWENDGDHYQTNIEFEKDSKTAVNRFEYLTKAIKGLPFTINGVEYADLQEVYDSEDKDSDGCYLADYILENIGTEYESSKVRTVESVKLYFLDEDGSLNYVFVELN